MQSSMPFGEQEQTPKKKEFHLFKKKQLSPQGPNISSIIEQTTIMDRRLKLIENRYTDLNRKMQMADRNVLNERKIVTKEIKIIDLDILDLKRQLNELKTKMVDVINELKLCARMDDLNAIKKYVELWEPVNFVTRNELDKIIQEKIEDNQNSHK